MILKKGVKIHGIGSEMMLGLIIANDIYKEFGYEMVVTSVVDGNHSKTSLHYTGNGTDLRTRNLKPTDREPIRQKIDDATGPDFDVILEDDHIHMEYQPRR